MSSLRREGGPRSEGERLDPGTHVLLQAMFFVSGFCGLLYQTVWMRLAFARFGVITPVVSVVVSVFMLGLGLGSWIGGKYVRALSERVNAIFLYGALEAVIGLGAFAVPRLLLGSSRLVLGLGESNSWAYLAGSGVCLFASIFPFSCAMGATYPAALRFLEQLRPGERPRFGRLYTFNTGGAVLGVLITVYVLIELLGLHGTLRVGFFGNLAIAVAAGLWGLRFERPSAATESATPSEVAAERPAPGPGPAGGAAFARGDVTILFVTGFCSMAMEVGWVRSFTPVLQHSVYAFAFLLAAYLTGHALGATAYATFSTRRRSADAHGARDKAILVGAVLVTASLPIAFADWAWAPIEDLHVDLGRERLAIALSIGAFAAVLGWLTPMLVDDISKGEPRHAGIAYAVNIAGCTLGPLVMGYAVLPLLGPRIGLVLLCVPLLGLLALVRRSLWSAASIGCAAGILAAALSGRSFEEGAPPLPGEQRTLYRDYTATTITRNSNGVESLLVNGNPMTTKSPITQMMAHLTFALHGAPPQRVLIICLGMGTTFRSALSWDVDVTVVELVPGVAHALKEFNPDTGSALGASRGRVVIDDGRRFLARTSEMFDVIIIDPPPPPEQPSSSLLYSTEFYELIKQHLNPGGILQQWWGFPDAEPFVVEAMAHSVMKAFPYVRVFRAVDDPAKMMWGYHFICSVAPVPGMTEAEFLARLPEGARRDLKAWSVGPDPEVGLEARIAEQLRLELPWTVPAAGEMITDDRPLNEYTFLHGQHWVSDTRPDGPRYETHRYTYP